MHSCPDDRVIRWEDVTFSFSENTKRNTLEHFSLSVRADAADIVLDADALTAYDKALVDPLLNDTAVLP